MYFISVTGKLGGNNIEKLIFMITMEKRMLLILIRNRAERNIVYICNISTHSNTIRCAAC